MSQEAYAEIAVGLNVKTTFHYKVPKKLQPEIGVGKRVWVPFHHRKLLGVVVGLPPKPDFKNLKSIYSVIDNTPVIDPATLDLTHWMADWYQASWGETILSALPSSIRQGSAERIVSPQLA